MKKLPTNNELEERRRKDYVAEITHGNSVAFYLLRHCTKREAMQKIVEAGVFGEGLDSIRITEAKNYQNGTTYVGSILIPIDE